jgi:hypothetical protein
LVNPAPVTEAGANAIGPFAPTGLGISPNVLATMDGKIPAQFAARIREHLRKK